MGHDLFTAAGIHRAIVHYPLALLVTGALFELLGRLLRKPGLSAASRYALAAGLLFSVPTVATGLLAAQEHVPINIELWRHRALALFTVAVFALAFAAMLRPTGKRRIARRAYTLGLVIGAVSALATGYYGGELGHHANHEDHPSSSLDGETQDGDSSSNTGAEADEHHH